MRTLKTQPTPGARPATPFHTCGVASMGATQRVLRLTARLWLAPTAALLRPRAAPTALDERVRASGEW